MFQLIKKEEERIRQFLKAILQRKKTLFANFKFDRQKTKLQQVQLIKMARSDDIEEDVCAIIFYELLSIKPWYQS